jgi:hypothetical protein
MNYKALLSVYSYKMLFTIPILLKSKIKINKKLFAKKLSGEKLECQVCVYFMHIRLNSLSGAMTITIMAFTIMP